MNILGWILAGILAVGFGFSQWSIYDYKLACADYRAAIAIYEAKVK